MVSAFKKSLPMNPTPEPAPFSRREFMRASAIAATALAGGITGSASAAAPSAAPAPHPLLTKAADFQDVSRGTPKPHSLTGDALVQARLTPETWRLEITADPFTSDVVKEPASLGKQFTLDAGNAIDLPALIELGKKHSVRFLKAFQCLNIAAPLGQGLWEGVPLRELLRLCGPMKNARRIRCSRRPPIFRTCRAARRSPSRSLAMRSRRRGSRRRRGGWRFPPTRSRATW